MDKLKELLNKYGYVSRELAKEHGISRYIFEKFVRDNTLERIGRGIYAAKDEWIDELYMIHKKCPSAVFSHDEALYYHGISDREPLVHTLTTYSGYNSHRLTQDGNCKVYTVKSELLDVGKITVKDNCGNIIPMYNLERTICDIVRNRSSVEIQEFSHALRAYVERTDKNLNQLMEYAKLFRVQNVIRKYMEVLI